MKLFITLGIVGLTIIGILGFFIFEPGRKNKGTTQVTTQAHNLRYKDGIYSAVGDYISPGGAEKIGVTITLKGDIIEDAKAQSKAFRPNTIRYQGIFIENFRPLVIGKNLDEVKLDKVSASSLTPIGFNDALEKIKAQAKG